MKSATLFLIAVACTLLVARAAPAHDPSDHGTPKDATGVDAKSVTVRLPDLELLDQDGKRVRFKSDVIGDRLVVIDVIYTTCPVVCPILSAVFANVQDALGDRLGKDVVLVSISVDPVTDVPARLKEYAQKWKARPGWTFLTGDKRNVDEVLRGLNLYAPDLTEHPTVMLVGDGRDGRWRRLYDFPAPARVLGEVDGLRAQRRASAR
jgi:protein SCO1/2